MSRWKEYYAAIYAFTCDICRKSDGGWHFVKGKGITRQQQCAKCRNKQK